MQKHRLRHFDKLSSIERLLDQWTPLHTSLVLLYLNNEENTLNLHHYVSGRKTITLIRHAESVANADHKQKQHIKDPPLTETGKTQARTLRKNVQLVVCSIMRRARETLALSSIRRQHTIFTSLARESGVTLTDEQTAVSNLLMHETMDNNDANAPWRVEKFVRLLASRKESNIAVISHGIFIDELLRYLNRQSNRILLNAESIIIRDIYLGHYATIKKNECIN